MAGELESAGILANLLALPYTIHQQKQLAEANRQMYASMLSPQQQPTQLATAGGPPGSLSDVGGGLMSPTGAFAPPGQSGTGLDAILRQYTQPTFPGFDQWAQTSKAAMPLRALGNVGHVLQMVLGGGTAPRPPLAELSAIARIKNLNQQQALGQALAQQYKNPRAQLLAQAGKYQAAEKAEGGTGGGSADFRAWQAEHGGNGSITAYWRDKYAVTHAGQAGKLVGGAHDRLVAQGLGIPLDRPWTAAETNKVIEAERQQGFQAQPGLEKDIEKEAERRKAAGLLLPQDEYEWKLSARADTKRRLTEAMAEGRPLGQGQQNTIAQLNQMKALSGYMRDLLNDPEVAKNRGVFWGRVLQQMYTLGIDTGGASDGYIAASNFLKILGTSAFIKGSRNFRYIGQIQQHLAASGDQPGLLFSKLDLIDWYADELTADIYDAAKPISQAVIPKRRAAPGAPAAGAGAGVHQELDDAGMAP